MPCVDELPGEDQAGGQGMGEERFGRFEGDRKRSLTTAGGTKSRVHSTLAPTCTYRETKYTPFRRDKDELVTEVNDSTKARGEKARFG